MAQLRDIKLGIFIIIVMQIAFFAVHQFVGC